MNRIMSTSIILLDQNFNANDVDLMVFEPSVLSPPRRSLGLGEIDDMVQLKIYKLWFSRTKTTQRCVVAPNDKVIELWLWYEDDWWSSVGVLDCLMAQFSRAENAGKPQIRNIQMINLFRLALKRQQLLECNKFGNLW